MTELIDQSKYYELEEITPEMIDALKRREHSYILVNTGKALKMISPLFMLRLNGDIEFSRFEQRSMSSYCSAWAPLTKQLDKVFDYENWELSEKKRLDRINEKKNEAHDAIEAGTIFVASYGYDACFSEFFQVTRSSDKSVWVRQLHTETEPGGSYLSWKVRPVKDDFSGSEHRHTVKWYGDSPSIKINSFEHGHIWDGRTIENYDYH